MLNMIWELMLAKPRQFSSIMLKSNFPEDFDLMSGIEKNSLSANIYAEVSSAIGLAGEAIVISGLLASAIPLKKHMSFSWQRE